MNSSNNFSDTADVYHFNHEKVYHTNSVEDLNKKDNRKFENIKFDFSKYIASDSINTITLLGTPIIEKAANEIARIVHHHGRIIIYGGMIDYYNALKKSLKAAGKNIFYYKNYKLEKQSERIPSELINTDYIFMPEKVIIDDFLTYVKSYNYEKAYDALYSLDQSESNQIKSTIIELIHNNITAAFNFAAKLYFDREANSLVGKYFPDIYTRILSGTYLNLRNNDYRVCLKLANKADSDGDRIAYGGTANSERLFWRFEFAGWSPDNLTPCFYIINNEFATERLKLGKDADNYGDHIVYGGGGGRCTWKIELANSGDFYIVNVDYGKFLKLGKDKDSDGDYKAYGGGGGRYTWQIGYFLRSRHTNL